MKTLTKILVRGLMVVVLQSAWGAEVGVSEQGKQEARPAIVLGPDAEEFVKGMNLTNPDVIQGVRTLLQHRDKVTSEQAARIVSRLESSTDLEAKKALADLLASENHVVRIFVIGTLPQAGEATEYFLTNIVEWWGYLLEKEKATLRRSLPRVLNSHKDDEGIKDFVEEITVLMIEHSGKKVPLAGIHLAKELGLKSDRIMAALETQRGNSIYDFFANEQPVRKAALELLGEEYVPPARKELDYSRISVAREMGIEPSRGLKVGLLTSLYTATGPCAGGGEGYGWWRQCYLFDSFGNTDIDTYIYYHPVTQVEDTPLYDKLEGAGLEDIVLNAASSNDLSLCNVVVLSGIYNLRDEVVDALENFVWGGGGIITIDGAGIISCPASKKFAALQDMRRLSWGWNKVMDLALVQVGSVTPLTQGIDLSLPVVRPGRALSKNGYRFRDPKYAEQILLRFDPDGVAALRVSTYGAGRIAHFGWAPQFGGDKIGRRNWELFHRIVLWAGGEAYKEVRPKAAYSEKRYSSAGSADGR